MRKQNAPRNKNKSIFPNTLNVGRFGIDLLSEIDRLAGMELRSRDAQVRVLLREALDARKIGKAMA